MAGAPDPTAACPQCGRTAAVVLDGPTETRVGTIMASVEQCPVVACDAGHRLVPPEVVGAAMEAVDERIARARSRLLRRDVCSACDTVLSLPARRSVRTVTVVSAVAPVVTIHLDVPASRCPDCGLDQVPSRSHEDLVVAIPAAFAASRPD